MGSMDQEDADRSTKNLASQITSHHQCQPKPAKQPPDHNQNRLTKHLLQYITAKNQEQHSSCAHQGENREEGRIVQRELSSLGGVVLNGGGGGLTEVHSPPTKPREALTKPDLGSGRKKAGGGRRMQLARGATRDRPGLWPDAAGRGGAPRRVDLE
ncbi:hypothetical protein Nepgr_016338 [Nepenthes gracilis]|uniref:Uncharacterized protein n=1 Tax=Nepenthes gracilis TaxID=150966 RepID=A0AAD3SP09_NEPGR|nr:hypothetical protein Nepgr_016338 [Nepenthes gracilis]